MESKSRATTVEMDFLHKPLPNIPLPNDIATRYDPSTPTLRRVNASMIAPTSLEKKIRYRVDQLDGWGVNQPITIPFSGPLDVESIINGHRDVDYRTDNDVIYLINMTPGEHYGELVHLDLGNGNYPTLLEEPDEYGPFHSRGWTISLLFEEADEDLNQNGVLDPEEDTDADGVLDRPNYLPCGVGRAADLPCDDRQELAKPDLDDLRGRGNALMEFYERESHTLIARPMIPLRERSTYAVVVTTRIKDAQGQSVGSPFKGIYHTSQEPILSKLSEVLPEGLSLDEVAFAFSYTTQSLQAHWIAVRQGLYGKGVQSHIGEKFPAQLDHLYPLKEPEIIYPELDDYTGVNPYLIYSEELRKNFSEILNVAGGNLDQDSYQFQALNESLDYIDYHVMGRIKAPQLFPRTYADLYQDQYADASTCDQVCRHVVDSSKSREALIEGGGYETSLDTCIMECGDWNQGQRACFANRQQGYFVCEDETPLLPYVDQVWPEDLDQKAAPTRSEDIVFWLTIPRKEVSSLKDGKPVPLVFVGHGYTLHRLDSMMGFAGQLAKQGNATIAIDCVSHGLYFPDSYVQIAETLSRPRGLAPILEPLLSGRALDQNRDGALDSGADFWTSYLFHTRDMVRQCALDHMQLIRIIKSFDGKIKWDFDVNNDGENELAGDFNADGIVDIGWESSIGITGTSLGGIMSGILAGLEPFLDVAVPIAGGGILSDIGMRSLQSGVREAVMFRLFSNIITLNEVEEGRFLVQTVLPQLNQQAEIPLGHVEGIENWDTVVGRNLQNGETRCAYILPNRSSQLNLPGDLGDLIRFEFYRGQQRCLCDEDLEKRCKAEPYAQLERFEDDVEFQGVRYQKDQPLETLVEGLGQERSTPRLRRFFHLSQLVLDAGDPATYGRHWLQEPLVYPLLTDQEGKTHETTTHTLLVTTMGDMNVPANSGLSLGRASGLIDYLNVDERYKDHPDFANLTPNEILIRTQSSEAIDLMSHFQDGEGNLVHIDVENLSDTLDIWVDREIPRLDPPLRLGIEQEDTLDGRGGKSGAIFPFIKPEGYHGFSFPGQEMDIRFKRCRRSCENGLEEETDEGKAMCETQCREEMKNTFDLGNFMSGFLGGYMKSGGLQLNLDPCVSWGCHLETLEAPEARELPIIE